MTDNTHRRERWPQEAWRRFAHGELTRGESRDLVRSALAAAAADDGPKGDLPSTPMTWPRDGYEEIWNGATAALKGESRRKPDEEPPGALLTELLRHAASRQRILVCEDPRFHSWPLCELLLERSWEAGFDNPKDARSLAELAVSVAAEIHTEAVVPEPLIFDLKARAWAYLGNARRITSDLRGAEKAFELAESLIERGTGDPVEEGGILELRASLAMAARRLDEAGRLLTRAGSLYRRAGSSHLEGRCRISRGLLWGQREEPARAVACLTRGLREIDPAREPRLRLVAVHNLCLYLSEVGRQEQALALLAEARELHDASGHALDRVRLRWLEGRLALASGRVEDAEEIFLEVRKEFIQREIGYDVALVSLDLAGVYARQKRAGEMRRLGEEMIPIFQARDLGREVLAALIVLQNAARMETVSMGLIEELATLLEGSRDRERDDHRDA